MDVDYSLLRSRLAHSILAGCSLEFAIRSELKAAGGKAPLVAMAMVIAALCMPDESHPDLNTRPTWSDVDHGLIGVNDFVIALRHGVARAQPPIGSQNSWILSVDEGWTDRNPGEQLVGDVAGFVGQTVLLRARGVRRSTLNWVALIGPP